MIDELNLDELVRVQARLFLAPVESSAVNQLDTPLADNAKASLIEEARDETSTDDEEDELIHRIDDTRVCIQRIRDHLLS